MELASMLAHERFSDRPQSVCPVIAAILRTYNDWIDDDRRGDMYRYAAESVGTRGDYALQQRRAAAAIAWVQTLRAPRGRLTGALLGARYAPEPDAGPEAIALFVVRAIRRATRWRRTPRLQAAHQGLLSLVDVLIELSSAPSHPAELALSSPAGRFRPVDADATLATAEPVERFPLGALGCLFPDYSLEKASK
jgi:hypothetical protein